MTDETGVRLAKRHDSLSLREMRRRGDETGRPREKLRDIEAAR
jgi:hypothetical protein